MVTIMTCLGSFPDTPLIPYLHAWGMLPHACKYKITKFPEVTLKKHNTVMDNPEMFLDRYNNSITLQTQYHVMKLLIIHKNVTVSDFLTL